MVAAVLTAPGGRTRRAPALVNGSSPQPCYIRYMYMSLRQSEQYNRRQNPRLAPITYTTCLHEIGGWTPSELCLVLTIQANMGKITIGITFLNNTEGATLLPSGQDLFFPGSTVQGNVTLIVHEKIKGDEVILSAYGKESTTLIHADSSRASGYKITHGERTHFQTHSVIGDMRNRTVQPGTYKFPFSIKLPESLPASFDIYIKDSAHGNDNISIHYGCKARIGSRKRHKDFGIQSVPLPDERVPCYLEPKTEAIRTIWRLHGCVTFAAGVDNAQVGAGQNVILSLAGYNKSAVDIQRISIKLVELYYLSAGGEYTGAVAEKVKKKVLFHINLWKKLTKVPRPDIQRSSQAANRENNELVSEVLRSGRTSIRLRIPMDAVHTHVGKISSISHYFKIYLHTDKNFTNNPSIKIPLKIGYVSS